MNAYCDAKVKALRDQADVLERAIMEGEWVEFKSSCNLIQYRGIVPEEDVILDDTGFNYSTTANGDAWWHRLILRGRDCGYDDYNRRIIKLASGKIVYYRYWPGDASSFDYGRFFEEDDKAKMIARVGSTDFLWRLR